MLGVYLRLELHNYILTIGIAFLKILYTSLKDQIDLKILFVTNVFLLTPRQL